MKLGSWSLLGSAAKVSRLVINLALGDPTQKWGVGVRWGWRHGNLHATGACGAGEWLNVEPALSHNRAVGQQLFGLLLDHHVTTNGWPEATVTSVLRYVTY